MQQASNDFYPRSPCGERPGGYAVGNVAVSISIHALLAESDATPAVLVTTGVAISIHALLAESDIYCHLFGTSYSKFLSTLSLRRATQLVRWVAGCIVISIHALLAESDP